MLHLPVGREEWEKQGRDYGEAVGACLETGVCAGVTLWDFTDQVCCLMLCTSSEGNERGAKSDVQLTKGCG